jgi:hypothetical protein
MTSFPFAVTAKAHPQEAGKVVKPINRNYISRSRFGFPENSAAQSILIMK